MSEVIRLLPDNIANQIAAGEVIQRPASVVKELIENAVDAGSSQIELHIKDAGKTSIQIIDDGKGMSEMDARMSFERHATSKISSAADLFSLSTKGFRGEALASIAAIAHVDMETVEAGEQIGTKIEIAGSKIESQEPCSRTKGTSICVKNLFFNVPARRNFLKSDNVETKHIVEEFNRIALTHPEVGFTFSHNGSIIHNLEIAGLRKRIVDLFGRNFNNKLVPIEEETDIVKVKGFIVKPEFARKTRGEQYFFVNDRFFKDNYFNHAVVSGYDNLLAQKHHPSYFIYLEVPSTTLDVNVHPTKTEVKFEDGRSIYSIIRSTVKLALGKYNIAPSLDFEHESQFDLSLEKQKEPIKQPEIQVDPTYNPFKTESSSSPSMGSSNFGSTTTKSALSSGFKSASTNSLKPNKEEWEDFYKITEEAEEEIKSSETEIGFEDPLKSSSNKIQLHSNLLLIQVKSGAMLVHINRANERILYDELMEHFMLSPISEQQLMFPYEYTLQSTQKLEWENNTSTLKRLGFTWDWQGNVLVLSSIPSMLEVEYVTQCLDGIVDKITHEDLDKGELVHELILSLSAAATKTKNKPLSEEEMNYLIDRLFQSEQHQYSPSGKKILNTITIEELNNFLS
ncbi:DNA mismatch repair endonuclease MutL [Brumimicrobium aurantiacum]|uniref:DNA mismatch repair protein MutL n=1 Tax=Brumimicrobium aurantiacum TaxID=1737063 RepID=A0A3E1EYX6_9FLAO|nr:DNA mismatch repair endonuclease MutL [Brumimicrobium aurantiacum]RFC54762.1 DNA mismatch repair endonuclease MutL [Brumimicrobium aurantiacum]